MKFIYMSDLHWEGRQLPKEDWDRIPEGDVLILAGDIITAAALEHGRNPEFSGFLKAMTEKFAYVIAIAGNHESYKSDYDESLEYLNEFYLDHGVWFLDNNHLILEADERDIVVYGGTMWGDFNKGNPIERINVAGSLNDYRLISRGSRSFTTIDAMEECQDFFRNIQTVKPDVVISHHAPSYQSVGAAFKDSSCNAGFASNFISEVKTQK